MKIAMQAQNLAQLFQIAARIYGDRPAFLSREGQKYTGPSFHGIYEQGLNIATALLDLGLAPRECVGLLADNRLEWMLAEYAIQFCGAVNVPRGTDLSDQDLLYILSHADVKFVFVENQNMLQRLQDKRKELPAISHIIVMDPAYSKSASDKKTKDIFSLYGLMEKGKSLREGGVTRRVEELMAQIKSEDLFTIIYTSGTTGEPKGVMLTHANIISQVRNIPLKITEMDRVLSILPIWHIFERKFEIACISKGASTHYTNVRSLREDIKLVRPTFMASAPRLWENIYLGIMKKVEGGAPIARALFRAAYFCAKTYKASTRFLLNRELDMEGRSFFVSLSLRSPLHLLRALLLLCPYMLLNFIVLRKIRKATGGALKFSVSGGGALPMHVDLFFNNIGIPVLEGYGMTETSPVISVRTPSRLVIGTVGSLWPETQLRLLDPESGRVIYPGQRGKKGEIHVKGPQVMKAYYKNPEASAKVLTDGWMNTGDLGIVTYNNMLKIVGRSKETIVLLGGENVEPVPIENKLLQSPLIEHCIVTGQDQKYLSCLVVPSPEGLAKYGSDHAGIAASQDARKAVQEQIKIIVSSENGFKSFEKIIDCRLLSKPFLPGEELTNLFKLKRHVISEKYKDLIQSMYN